MTKKALESMIERDISMVSTEVEYEEFPKGISEEIVREISKRKNEPDWMTDFRVKAYHAWREMTSLMV